MVFAKVRVAFIFLYRIERIISVKSSLELNKPIFIYLAIINDDCAHRDKRLFTITVPVTICLHNYTLPPPALTRQNTSASG